MPVHIYRLFYTFTNLNTCTQVWLHILCYLVPGRHDAVQPIFQIQTVAVYDTSRSVELPPSLHQTFGPQWFSKKKTWEMKRCWIHFWATCASCLVCSVQQYLELRFNRATRLLGTVLFIIQTVSETLARCKVPRWLRGSWGIRVLLVRRSCSPESSSTAQRWPWVRVCHCFSDICTQPHQPILLHEGFKNIINKKIAFKSYRAIFFPLS